MNEQSGTWQQMAERLGVEAREETHPYGKTHGYFSKGERLVEVCPHYAPVLNKDEEAFFVKVDEYEDYDLPGFLKPSEARDLSDCLQVAARYLEEQK